MNKKFLYKCLISFGLLLFFTFLPQIIPTPVSIAQASEIEKEKNNEYRLNLRTITLVNGKSFTLRVYNLEKDAKVSFRSADPEIASVSVDGTITANKVGSTTITATIRRGLNPIPLTCEVTIGPPAFSVKMTRSTLILGLNQNYQLEAVMKPTNTAELAKFSSFDPTIASVSSGGRVTAKKPGMTYVFAEIDATNPNGNRKFSSCSVIVSNEEDVSLLKDYFSSHSELGLISETELSNALFDFFNSTETSDDKTNATETSKTENGTKDTSSRIDNNNATRSTDTATNNSNSGLSLVESLDKHLNARFDLAQLRQQYEERFQIITEIQLSSLYTNTIRR